MKKININWKVLGKATALVVGFFALLYGIMWACSKSPLVTMVVFCIALISIVYALMNKEGY